MRRTREQIKAELEQGVQEMEPVVDAINKRLASMTDEEKSQAIENSLLEGEKKRKELINKWKEQYRHGPVFINSFDSHDITLDEFLRREGII